MTGCRISRIKFKDGRAPLTILHNDRRNGKWVYERPWARGTVENLEGEYITFSEVWWFLECARKEFWAEQVEGS